MVIQQPRYLVIVERMAALLLLAYPTATLVIKGGVNWAFLLMLLLTFIVWVARPVGMATVAWRREWTIYVAAMLAMTAAIFISQSYHQVYAARPYDAASRYWLGIPLFFLLQQIRPVVFAALQYAFPLAAIIGFLLAKDMGGRSGINTLDLIHFGDLELIFAMLSLFSISWFGRDQLPLRILKISGFTAGLAASIASGTRGGWLAIPVFVAIFIYFWRTRLSLKTVVSTMIAVMLGALLLYSYNPTLKQRVGQLISDVSTFQQGNRDTSAGIRWQLYGAAVDIFARHPVFGVGPNGFAREMQPMVTQGALTPTQGELGRGEVHNDILAKAAELGVFGLIAILAVYFVPFRLFWQATKSASEPVRRAGILGVTFVSGFFIFGLTVEFLNLTLATAFYSFTVAVLLAACYNIHLDKQNNTRKPNKDNHHV